METTMNPDSTSNLERGRAEDQSAVNKTAAAAHSTVDKVASAATPAADRLAAGAHQMVDKVAEMAAAKGEQLRVQQEQLIESCRGYVRDNPITALGIAVAAGFVLSRILSNR
jgi:ElaB/YqjD/DUF883 family membrane-anchored ribosome-binding protein